jgi:hypothetical protein
MNGTVNTVLSVHFSINLFVGFIVFAWTVILTLWLHPDLSQTFLFVNLHVNITTAGVK